jgi:hypothetical protein
MTLLAVRLSIDPFSCRWLAFQPEFNNIIAKLFQYQVTIHCLLSHKCALTYKEWGYTVSPRSIERMRIHEAKWVTQKHSQSSQDCPSQPPLLNSARRVVTAKFEYQERSTTLSTHNQTLVHLCLISLVPLRTVDSKRFRRKWGMGAALKSEICQIANKAPVNIPEALLHQ